jgi:heat-inducible transcriptional repressor
VSFVIFVVHFFLAVILALDSLYLTPHHLEVDLAFAKRIDFLGGLYYNFTIMWLKKRDALILIRLIEIYISTHKPVGSAQLAPGLNLSCSSVRKELQKLESYGFIFKPSSSSGRIPTNRGIKYYIKHLIDNFEIGTDTMDLQLPEIVEPDFNNMSENYLSLLATQTHNIGFIFLNSIFDLNFKQVRLFKVGAHKVMTIIHSVNKWTFSKIFKTHENYPEKDLKQWENILNREFKGRTLKNTFKSIRNKLFKEKEKYLKIYRELYFLLGNEELMTAEFFFKGTLNILDSDLVNPYKVKKLLETLEEKENLTRFLNDIFKNSVKSPIVAFGTDTGISDLEDFILIFSNFYYSRNPIGNIGVIGPKFMPYPTTLSRVELFSSHFSKILSKNPLEV